MILSGAEIEKQIKRGTIKIEPFDPEQLTPNSYKLHLDNQLLVDGKSVYIPTHGLVLQPGIFYLGSTVEKITFDKHKYYPERSGRSSTGRLGMYIHEGEMACLDESAHGLLPITVLKPLRVYPNTEVAQLYFNALNKSKGGILSDGAITQQMKKGNIAISPFCPGQLRSAGYVLRLHNELVVYTDDVLDMKTAPKTRTIQIPKSGFELEPNQLYLGRTVETTNTKGLVPKLTNNITDNTDGLIHPRTLGLDTHITAPLGHTGFNGHWVLEIASRLKGTKVYPGMEICEIWYHTLLGEQTQYKGRYQNQTETIPSLIRDDFDKGLLKSQKPSNTQGLRSEFDKRPSQET